MHRSFCARKRSSVFAVEMVLWLRFGRFWSLYIHYLSNTHTYTGIVLLCTQKLKPCGNLLKNSRAHFDNLTSSFLLLAHTIAVKFAKACFVSFSLNWMNFCRTMLKRCIVHRTNHEFDAEITTYSFLAKNKTRKLFDLIKFYWNVPISISLNIHQAAH